MFPGAGGTAARFHLTTIRSGSTIRGKAASSRPGPARCRCPLEPPPPWPPCRSVTLQCHNVVNAARSIARQEWHFIARYRRSEEHTSELQSLMRISYAVFCLKKQKKNIQNINSTE